MELGLTLQEFAKLNLKNETLKNAKGAVVEHVKSGSIANLAGIVYQDIILALDGREISSIDELNNLINAKKPGDKIDICVYKNKDGEIKNIIFDYDADQPDPHWIDTFGSLIITLTIIAMVIISIVWLISETFLLTHFVALMISGLGLIIFGSILKILAKIELHLRVMADKK